MSLERLVDKFNMDIMQGVGSHSAKIMEPNDLDIALHGSCQAKARDAKPD
jgi:hypothetical protein